MSLTYRCRACKGTRVLADAWVNLNDPLGIRIFDATYCDDCEGECSVDEMMDPPPVAADATARVTE